MRIGASLIIAGFVVVALFALLDGPVVAYVLAVACASTGGSMVGSEIRRRGVEQDRQARERRIAAQRQPWPGSEARPGDDRG
jgi:multisubunit Na+/H+ antiporter MnhG subunit